MTLPTYFSICSRNYLAYARTLFRSLAAAEPNARRVLFLADAPDGIDAAAEPFEVVAARDVAIPDFEDMAFRYTVMEFNTAIKPFCIKHLWAEGAERVVYLDPDIQVFAPLTPVREAFDAGADLALTPHTMQPLADGKQPDDRAILQSGVYNLGFGAFRNAGETRKLVDWWAERLRTDCRVDLEEGLFVDQRFMDMGPAFVRKTAVLRHPGLNVAYWNLASRQVTRDGDGWAVDGKPLIFFHFSGVVPGDRSVFSKHQNRFSATDLGEARALLDGYLESLDREGRAGWSKTPYAYGTFSDGRPIPESVRRVYRRLHPEPQSDRPPFDPDWALYNRLATDAPGFGQAAAVTELMYDVWRSRPDLQPSFPLTDVGGRQSFASWFLRHGLSELGLPDEAAPGAVRGAAAKAAGGVSGAASRAILQRTDLLRPLYRNLPVPLRQRVRRMLLTRGYSSGAAEAAERVHNASLEPGVALIGYLKTESGVGEGARRAYRALKSAGVDVEAVAVGTGGTFPDAVEETPLAAASSKRLNLIHMNADQMAILDQLVPPTQTRGRYAIGYWAWELSEFPAAWSGAFAHVDEIWCPSAFTADAVRKRTTKPVTVMPHPVETPPRSALTRADFGLPDGAFCVLTAFDLNSYPKRKNPDGAIAAFREAFPDQKDVRLVLKLHGGAHERETRAALAAATAEDARIRIEDRLLSREDYGALQSVCDAYLSLHRSEGFGLNLAECMALGKPVVATGYSGNIDFMNEENALLVPYDLTPLGRDDYPFADGQVWAEPDVGGAARALRTLREDHSARARIGAAAKNRINQMLAPARIGSAIASRIAEIEDRVYAPQSSGGSRS
ncbi:MAG: glycosyltransferase [Pseudomonadota bacterium]